MGNSLQDQLLKAGLANKQQAQKANSQRRKQQNKKNKGAAPVVDDARQQVRQAQAEQAARDRALNRHKQEALQERAVAAQIRQLIEMNRLSREEAGSVYHFVDGGTVRQIYVSPEMHRQLGKGVLAIVRLDEQYELVSRRVANKISERDVSIVIAHDQPATRPGEDDPYADYQVPDDLMW